MDCVGRHGWRDGSGSFHFHLSFRSQRLHQFLALQNCWDSQTHVTTICEPRPRKQETRRQGRHTSAYSCRFLALGFGQCNSGHTRPARNPGPVSRKTEHARDCRRFGFAFKLATAGLGARAHRSTPHWGGCAQPDNSPRSCKWPRQSPRAGQIPQAATVIRPPETERHCWTTFRPPWFPPQPDVVWYR